MKEGKLNATPAMPEGENPLVTKLVELSGQGKENEVEDLVHEEWSQLLEIPGAEVFRIAGLAYNTDACFVNLPNGEVVYFEVGDPQQGPQRVEYVKILSLSESYFVKSTREMANALLEVSGTHLPTPEEIEWVQDGVAFLRQQLDLAESFLKRRI